MGWPNSKHSDWHKFLTLSTRERRLLAVSIVLLPVLAAAQRLLGLRRLHRALNRLTPGRNDARPDEAHAEALVRSVSRIVQIAARRGLLEPTCLEQSVCLRWLLARRGIATSLRIGVRRHDGRLEAHAWVEYLGVALNDMPDVSRRFKPFSVALSLTSAAGIS